MGLFILLSAFFAGLLLANRPADAEKVPFNITIVSDRDAPIQSLTDAQEVLTHSSAPAIMLEEQRKQLRFANGIDRRFGPFGENRAFAHARGFDPTNFALQTSDWINIPTAGAWTFGVASDDGFSMTVDGQTFSHTGRRAARTTLQTIDFPAAGDYPIELTYFQHQAGSELEAFAAPGTHTRMGRRQGFHLINANAVEALQLVDPPTSDAADPPPTVGTAVPEPVQLAFMGLSMTMMLLWRKR